MKLRFASWLKWAPLTAVPLLAAAWLNTDSLEKTLADRAAESLKAAGAEWAAVTLDGRDAVLSGEGPSAEAIEAAAKAVAGTAGVRVVDAASLKVAEALAAPAVTSAVTNRNQPDIKGTWPEALAKSLIVTLNGKPYTLGANPELTSDGAGNWTLKTPEALADGGYDVTAEITDTFERIVKSATPGKLVIDTVAPAAPTFNSAIGPISPAELTGTWAEGDAKDLKVTVGGKTYAVGSDPALTSLNGAWRLRLPEALPEGAADVTVESADPAGNIAAITVKDGVVVDSQAPAAPTVDSYAGSAAPLAITGTWAEGDAQSLTVTVGGAAYNFRTYLGLTTSNGKWTLRPATPLAEGVTEVTVKTADRAGNVSRGSGTIVVDSVPPAPPVVDTPKTATTPDKITGSWDEKTAAALKVIVDGTAYLYRTYTGLTSANGRWTLKPATPLAAGEHRVTVETADAAGNVSSATGTITVDATPPAGPAIDAVLSNQPIIALSGTWAEGDAVSLKVAVAGRQYLKGTYTGLASSAGKWTLHLPEPLGEGAHEVVVETADAAGNVSSATGVVTVDQTPPASAALDVIISAKPIDTLTGSWAGQDAKSLKVTVDGSDYILRTYTGLSARAEKWTLKLPAPLAEGTHSVAIETADAAGNIGKSAGEVIVDMTAPARPAISQATFTSPPNTITGTWAEGDAKSLSVTIDGSQYVKGTYTGLTSANGRWRLDLPAALAEGSHDIAVATADAAGNLSSAMGMIIVDQTAPAAATLDPALSATPIASLSGSWAEKDAQSLTVTVDGSSYILRTFSGLASTAGRWTLKLPAPLSEGEHDVVIETADIAGNTSRIAGKAIVDSLAPPPPTVDKQLATAPVQTITGTWAEGDAKSLKVSVGGNLYQFRTYNGLTSQNGKWTLALAAPLAKGDYDVTVETADAVGNASNITVPAAIVIEALPNAPTVERTAGNNARPQIAGTWDAENSTGLSVTIAGRAYTKGVDAGLAINGNGWTLVPAEPLKDGIYDVVATAVTSRGGTVKDGSVAEVEIDTTGPQAPTVNVSVGNNPQPAITGTLGSESKSLSVTLNGKTYVLGTDAALTADQSGAWTLKPSEPLPEGIHDVDVAAGDSFGNETRDASVAEIAIDLTGPDAPVVNKTAGNDPRPEVTGTLGKGTKGLTITLAGRAYVLGADAELTSDGVAWTLKPSAVLKDGVYDVVVSATDAYGNASKDATVAEVEIDTTGPQVPTVNVSAGNNPQPAITGTVGGDAKSLSVTLDGKTYTLGQDQALSADGGNWILTPPAPLPEGIHDVEVAAADSFGNKTFDASLAEITVDVTGPEAPTVGKLAAKSATPEITGTIGKGTAALNVTLDGKTYVLGADQDLKLDGMKWSLTPPSPLNDGVYDVVALAADTYGNTTQDGTEAELQIDTRLPPMAAPTVAAATVAVARPKITGTWSEGIAKTLKVTVDGATYALGPDEALTSDGSGNWTLALPRPLRDGTYDVVAESGNDTGTVSDTTKDELIVDAAGPGTPTVQLYSSDKSPATISGTWAEGDAVNLAVTLNGKAALLGTDGKLQSDGKGNWTLSVDETLAPGSYDVAVSTADKAGRNATDQTKFEILVKQIVAAQTPPEPPKPADCGAELAKLMIVDPITFSSDRAAIRQEENGVIEKIAQVMTACPDSKFEIAGHTDWVGSTPFNQALSERRAVAVRRALMKRGIDGGRLSAEGYGEVRPLASNDTPEGRSLNRRIEITVVK